MIYPPYTIFTPRPVSLQASLGEDRGYTLGGAGPRSQTPTSSNFDVAIHVLSCSFWNPIVTAAPPFYERESVRLGDHYLIAGVSFGQDAGSGTGSASAVATSLSKAINALPGYVSVASSDMVYVLDLSGNRDLRVGVTSSSDGEFGGPSFELVRPGGAVYAAKKGVYTFPNVSPVSPVTL